MDIIIFHIMGNRFVDANPGSCDEGDVLLVKAERDAEGSLMKHISCGRVWFDFSFYFFVIIGSRCFALFIYNQWWWYSLPSLLIECNVVDVVYVLVVDDVDVFVM